jgi:carboxyl-terminal processing protease
MIIQKYFYLCLFLLSLTFGCSSSPQKSDAPLDAAQIQNHLIPTEAFEKFWQISKANIYPKELEQKYFTQNQYDELRQLASQSADIYELSTHLNPFLKKLNVSHTNFYTDQDLDFYFFRSLFSTRDPNKPEVEHIGAEYLNTAKGYAIRSVLDGFAAQKSGLRRGDVILKANGNSFHPVLSFKNKNNSEVRLSVLRGSKIMEFSVTPKLAGLHRAYIEATQKSTRIIPHKNKKIGYVHLWTGTHDESVQALQKSINELRDTDALILDLRDGYGGAWWNHLDPFFQSTRYYFKATWVDRDNKTTDMNPELKENTQFYTRPMVVLINEGVRSGKEALAFQFKKTKRATLVGTKTAGFFVGGAAHFRDLGLPYFLYLSSKGLLLDGVDLEGNGVTPDVQVAYPVDSKIQSDPQMAEALRQLHIKMR